MLFPQLLRMDSVLDLGDPLFSIWRIGWVYRQLLGDPRALFDANIFHPEPLTFAYSDSMLLPALAAAPLLAAGVHPVVTYNILLVGSFYLSAVATYFLVRELTDSRPAAFVAGLIFAFYPFRFEHYSHLELLMGFWMPLALLALHRFAATARIGWAAAAAACAVAQLYSSMYLALFFGGYAVIVTAGLAFRHRAQLRALIPGALLAAVIVSACAMPLSRAYSANPEVAGGRDAPEVEHYSATRLDFLRAQKHSPTWAHRTPPGRMVERTLFPGLMAPVLACIGLFPPAGAVGVAYGAGLLFAYEAAHGSNGYVFPVLARLPPFRSIRVPARFSLLVGLSLAILAGFGTRRLLRHAGPPRVSLTIGILALAIAIDLRSTLALQPVWRRPPPLYASLPEDAVLAELPALGEQGQFSSIPYLYFSVWHGRAMINGYSGYSPAWYPAVAGAIDTTFLPGSLEALRKQGATHLTVNCALFRVGGYPDRCPHVIAALDALPALSMVSRASWEGEPVVVYRIVR